MSITIIFILIFCMGCTAWVALHALHCMGLHCMGLHTAWGCALHGAALHGAALHGLH